MDTEHGQGYTQSIQGQNKWMMPLVWILFTAIFLAIFSLNTFAADEKLNAGEWKGKSTTHDGTHTDLKYIVSYEDESDTAPVKITLIYLGTGFTSESTYHLSEIKIEGKQINFKIPKRFETKECTLEKKDDAYIGDCLSSAGNAEETGEKITMEPLTGQ